MKTRTITQNEWDNLKTGDVLVTPLGKERTILKRKGQWIELRPLTSTSKKKTVSVLKSDIWTKYRVKGADAPTLSKKGKFEDWVEFTALQFIRALIMKKPECLLSSEAIVADFATEVRKYLK